MKLKKDYIILCIGIFTGIFLTCLCVFFALDKFHVFSFVKTEVSSTDNKNIEDQIEQNSQMNEELIKQESSILKKEDNKNYSDSFIKSENNNGDNKKTQNDIVIYFNELDNTIFSEESIKKYKDKAKQNFIMITDFIFYDAEIYGYTFDELSDNIKLKIMSIMMGIDSKMEQYFPNYKDIIKNKYNNIKEVIVSEYLEISDKICLEIGTDACNEAKKGLEILKENFNLTFDNLKSFGKTELENLKDWYEIFREENKID